MDKGKSRERIMRCKDCNCFSGFNPFPKDDEPAAFCTPLGESFINPCEPYEVASCKPCFVSPKKGS